MVVVAAATFATALGAQMPRLPDGLALPKSADSPGQVTFNHVTHVDDARPDCTTCHPRLFGVLGASAPRRRPPIAHERMEKGQQCGACHDGRKAFAIEDDCSACHRDE